MMILQLCRTGRIISSKLKYGQNIYNKGLCHERTLLQNKHLIKLGISQKRNFFGFWRRPSIDELKIKDNVPASYKLIYKNRMENYLLLVQFVTTITASALALKIIYSGGFNIFPARIGDKTLEDSDSLILVTFFILAVVALQVLLVQLPVRIYNFPQARKYHLVFYGNVPFTKRIVTCTAGELIQFSEGSISYAWKRDRYLLKDKMKIIYLFEHYFQRPADLAIMMGLQDDPDIEDKENPVN